MEKVTLRQAEEKDLPFLFNVSTLAMEPVVKALNGKPKDFDEYKKNFKPEKIQIIQYDKHDVGRLRVVRSAENIYVGGIQILPEFQHKGIGTAILKALIAESEQFHFPILLEVHAINLNAQSFYKRLGFCTKKVVGEKIELEYIPSSQI